MSGLGALRKIQTGSWTVFYFWKVCSNLSLC